MIMYNDPFLSKPSPSPIQNNLDGTQRSITGNSLITSTSNGQNTQDGMAHSNK